jgi:hypothetical protein
MDKEQQLKEVDKEIIKIGIIDAPGTIMLGLGLYAKFAANGNAFHPILNNHTVVNALIFAGAAIMVWGAFKLTTLSLKKAKIRNDTE